MPSVDRFPDGQRVPITTRGGGSLMRCSLAVLTVLTGLALVTLPVTPVAAQPVPGQEPGIVAVGFGSASTPAATATLQFLLGSSQTFGMGEVIEEVPVDDPVGEGTPGPDAMPPTLTEDQLAPV